MLIYSVLPRFNSSVYGFIFLFKWTRSIGNGNVISTDGVDSTDSNDGEVFFAQQVNKFSRTDALF